jgi:soluble P-type ATPase
MQKNVTGQKWIVFAFDRTDGSPLTGDALNITANLRIDGGAANAVDDLNPTELEDGYYSFDITQAETNGDMVHISPESSTSNIQVIGVPGTYTTTAPNYNALGIESDGDITKTNLCANTTLVDTTSTNTDMRGTDSAALASVATEARLAELDAAKLPATTDRNETALAFISGDTAAILVDTNQMQGKLPTNNFMGSSVTTDKDGEIDSILAESRHISGDLVIVSGDTAAILVDTNQMQGKLPTNNFMGSSVTTDKDGEIDSILAESRHISGDLVIVSGDTAAILVDTNEMQGKLPVNNFMGSSVTTDKDDEIDAIKAVTDNLPNSGALNDLATNLAETRHISGDLVLVSGDTVAIKAKTDNLPEGIKKNTAYSNFQFFMRDTSDHVSAKTGLSVSSNRSIDGGAFASTANSPSEISNGFYKIDLDAADLNGDTISFRFSATGADDTAITIITNV